MTVPDDVSPGELDRRLDAHERRTDRIHEALDTRITNVARDSVPLTLYQQGERDRDKELQQIRDEHAADIKQVRVDLRELRDRPQMTVARWVGLATVAIMLVALLIQAYGTLKGVK